MMSAEHNAGQQKALSLFFENPIASGIVNTIVDGSIGGGLSLESAPNYKILGMDESEIKPVKDMIEWYWSMWTKNPILCDTYGKKTFGFLQREAYTNALASGDMLLHIRLNRISDNAGLLLPRIQNISGQAVMSPNRSDSDTIKGGVETDSLGREIAYHVAKANTNACIPETERVSRYGTRTGRLQYNLVVTGDVTPGQIRGRSILLRVMDQIIQIGRYSEAELVKAIVQANYTVFLESETELDESVGNDPMEQVRENSDTWAAIDSDGKELPPPETQEQQMQLGPGAIWRLPPGLKATMAESKSPVAEYMNFIEAQIKVASLGVDTPYEVLLKAFNTNYSASQASIQTAARNWRIRTDGFASQYNQIAYEQFVEMLVRQNIIKCKGFLEDPIMRMAWCEATWRGPAILNIDPLKNVNASVQGIRAGLTTPSIEARRLYDNDIDDVTDSLRAYQERVAGLGLKVDYGDSQYKPSDEQGDGGNVK
jgi:lambda family phage portal protein